MGLWEIIHIRRWGWGRVVFGGRGRIRTGYIIRVRGWTFHRVRGYRGRSGTERTWGIKVLIFSKWSNMVDGGQRRRWESYIPSGEFGDAMCSTVEVIEVLEVAYGRVNASGVKGGG